MNQSMKQYLGIIGPRWRWVAWGAIIAVALTAAVLLLWPPRYRTQAMLFVRTPGDVSQVIDGGDTYAQTRAETYAALAKTSAISSRVVADTGLQLSPLKLASRVQARHIGGTALLELQVTGPSSDEARRTAEALITELTTEVRTVEAVPGALTPRAELVVVDPPSDPTRIVAWGAPLYPFILGPLVAGAFLGALGATLRSMKSHVAVDDLPIIDDDSDSYPSTNASETL
jgi:capsular polysaccharide biosynthesis protein